MVFNAKWVKEKGGKAVEPHGYPASYPQPVKRMQPQPANSDTLLEKDLEYIEVKANGKKSSTPLTLSDYEKGTANG